MLQHRQAITAFYNEGIIMCYVCVAERFGAQTLEQLIKAIRDSEDYEWKGWSVFGEHEIQERALDNGYECPGDHSSDVVDDDGRCLTCSDVCCDECGRRLSFFIDSKEDIDRVRARNKRAANGF